MAFVNSFTPSLQSVSSPSFVTPSVSPVRRGTATHNVTPAVMRVEVDIAEKVMRQNATFTSLEENRLAKEQSYFVPQRRFSLNAEKINGRFAMMGFVIGLTTEVITGKGINEQLLALFAPISHLFG